ncbi:hypothetical protein P7228_02135 [Altererythrobacter arenosus]|uniref:Lipoprotein n=1 Tax=Altererythrobacter arenosus TaxID=3032592 RepID=A0ABY8FS97_9SPHN|nr:hypothetical protein [Altererythrobacter sp. CAU 1644]WFL77891.1 hypothetical protein P7228_02135 [Altererythrobacter sp. CAU 1644]
MLMLLSLGACSANAHDSKLRTEIEAAYWIVSDGCAYSTDEAALSPWRKGKARYHHLKVQANGLPRGRLFASVEAQVNELLSRMDIDCPETDSAEALAKLDENGRALDTHLNSIERLLKERPS